ncbi:GNAT family N-acetyltransferase [Streptomyces sp. NPDC001717]|uniref:GNAT family N-acetyltransferase n=1 Tax=Streptomyces sp. NPDC001717 TaxID=3364604 RepID=UPI0036958176
MKVIRFAEADVPGALARQVADLEEAAWPGSTPGHDPLLAPRALLLVHADGTVLASLALLFKEVPLAGRTYRAAGLSAVVTRAALRGKGHGGRLVRAARAALAADPAVDLALFSCDRPLVPFYEAAGFEGLPRHRAGRRHPAGAARHRRTGLRQGGPGRLLHGRPGA